MEKGLKFTKLMCIINSRIMSVRFRDKGAPYHILIMRM